MKPHTTDSDFIAVRTNLDSTDDDMAFNVGQRVIELELKSLVEFYRMAKSGANVMAFQRKHTNNTFWSQIEANV